MCVRSSRKCSGPPWKGVSSPRVMFSAVLLFTTSKLMAILSRRYGCEEDVGEASGGTVPRESLAVGDSVQVRLIGSTRPLRRGPVLTAVAMKQSS